MMFHLQLRKLMNRMKLKKSAGPDGLTAKHLKYGGQSIINWLTGILNSVNDVEQVPRCVSNRGLPSISLFTKVEARILFM